MNVKILVIFQKIKCVLSICKKRSTQGIMKSIKPMDNCKEFQNEGVTKKIVS